MDCPARRYQTFYKHENQYAHKTLWLEDFAHLRKVR